MALPPAVAPRLNAESLSPNRPADVSTDAATAVGMQSTTNTATLEPLKQQLPTLSLPPPSFHHSRSISLDGEPVPNDSVFIASKLSAVSSPPIAPTSLLGPPVAVTIDAATPPAAAIPAPEFPSVPSAATESPASNSAAVDSQQPQQQQTEPADPTKVYASCFYNKLFNQY